MSEDAFQEQVLIFFNAALTFIALVALVAIVFSRTSAQVLLSSRQVSQSVYTSTVAPVLIHESLTQLQGENDLVEVGYPGPDLPPENGTSVLLTAGELSRPLELDVEVTEMNGFSRVLAQPHASVTVMAVAGDALPETCDSQNGSQCWTESFSGDDASVFVPASPDPDEVDGHVRVQISLPYYAKPGVWSMVWTITPVDDHGVPQPSLALSNRFRMMRWVTAEMTAMDVPVSASYTISGQPLMPNTDSDPLPIRVSQKGNVPIHVYVYGDDWTCSSGQTMSVAITKVSSASFASWSDERAVSLRKGAASKQLIGSRLSADWTVPETEGSMFGNPQRIGYNDYVTMIHVPDGISGTCTSYFVNIAAHALP